MPQCPCCSDVLLRHIKRGDIYWFCRSCWQTMPVFEYDLDQRKALFCIPNQQKSFKYDRVRSGLTRDRHFS